jgi:hypothetical protein
MDYATRNPQHATRPLSFNPRSGVALVVTLILLSVITFMAIAFLFLSRSERGAVANTTEQKIASLAAESAQNRAITELLSDIMSSTNEFNYGVRVSTNYISGIGFDPNAQPASPLANVTNVNYERTVSGLPLNPAQQQQNLGNLMLAARPPVYIYSKTSQTALPEFRYYLDLNRNLRFDTNGLLPVISPTGGFYDTNGNELALGAAMPPGGFLSNYFVGDPEWIGDLEFPDRPHGPDNRFVSRHAYIAVPAGQALDWNYVHNYCRQLTPTSMASGDGLLRNQGTGTWEDNLAAALVDLNTNFWPLTTVAQPLIGSGQPYSYSIVGITNWPPSYSKNTGCAFDDAVALLRYRYAANWNVNPPFLYVPPYSIFDVTRLFGAVGANAFTLDNIDGYTHGPVMTRTAWPPPGVLDGDGTLVRGGYGWAGSPNPNRFFTTQELFDKTKTTVGVNGGYTFTDRLLFAGTNIDSYNRYSFYRMSDVLSTDTAPEPPKLNLNYVNVDNNGNLLPYYATNFVAWNPIQFFTNAAVRLLQNAGYSTGLGFTNLLLANSSGLAGFQIQVYPTNFYTPNVHRLLQVAANIYDAITNRTFGITSASNGFPTIFRPVFRRSGTNVFITAYGEVTDTTLVNQQTAPRMLDLTSPIDVSSVPVLGVAPAPNLAGEPMVYGFPLVIGAKKGYPNFNTLALLSTIQASRKLEFKKVNGVVQYTNQMYMLSISNSVGVEGWNSYSPTFPRELQVGIALEMFTSLTNQNGNIPVVPTNQPVAWGPVTNFATWNGFADVSYLTRGGSMKTWTNFFFALPQMAYSDSLGLFQPTPPADFSQLSKANEFPVPQWWLKLRTRLRFYMVDTTANRIIDYVNLDSPEAPVEIAPLLATGGNCDPTVYTPDGAKGSMWCTNRADSRVTTPTYGILNQIAVSAYLNQVKADGFGGSDSTSTVDNDAIVCFATRLFGQNTTGLQTTPNFYCVETNVFYTPYNPTRKIVYFTSWQANDPLVHYTIPDLVDLITPVGGAHLDDLKLAVVPGFGPAQLNNHYHPWNGRPGGSGDATDADVSLKDPVPVDVKVNKATNPNGKGLSDNWDFPTSRFPNTGWLGRVHRGTPWQTVFLKSPPANMGTWQKWSGHDIAVAGNTRINIGQLETSRVALTNAFSEAYLSHPTNDWSLLDLFTTSLSDSATRGQLSINQKALPAWSAVLAGVNVLPDLTTNTFIDPAGPYNAFDSTTWPPLARIVNGINQMRTNFAYGAFHKLGDVLATPELTVRSPYLSGSTQTNDMVLERIPQQIAGLIKCDRTPRFVIYSYGQTLKPAEGSIVTGGSYIGLCTNYQVTAEVATRAVVRVENVLSKPHVVIETYNVLPPD